MSEKIYAPFTFEQVSKLNKWQEDGSVHPFTCCSYGVCERLEQARDGALFATVDGWVCPCGRYKQNWAYEFMIWPIHSIDKNDSL